MDSFSYLTIAENTTAEYQQLGSKFLAFAFMVESEIEVKNYLTTLKKQHPTAVHFCFAFVIGAQKQLQKSSDDREPTNSAGKPILRAIISSGVTNTLVVVVRYFGGKLLGVSGLIQAYNQAAVACLLQATKKIMVLTQQFSVSGNFNNENDLYKICKFFDAKIIEKTYNQHTFECVFEVSKQQANELEAQINNKRLFNLTCLNTP